MSEILNDLPLPADWNHKSTFLEDLNVFGGILSLLRIFKNLHQRQLLQCIPEEINYEFRKQLDAYLQLKFLPQFSNQISSTKHNFGMVY